MTVPASGARAVTRRKVAYGPEPSQFGHLYLPGAPGADSAPMVVLIHGGFWSTEYALTINTAVARDLARRGAVVWNIEYRRREEGGGWPKTGKDVVAALRALDGPVADTLTEAGVAVDRARVAVVGHSAGGQLAAWAVARLGARTSGHRITTVVPQSAVLDFTVPGVRDKTSVTRLMGVPYQDAPERYRDASPAHAPVTDATIALVHTTDDQAIPPALSRHYAEVMRERGQTVTVTEVPGDHAAFVDPSSTAHRQTLRVLGL